MTIEDLKNKAFKFTYKSADYDKLLELIGNAEFVLIGESTHGTHEFYYIRAELTKRLIEQKLFDAVAIEGDWPDTYCINQYVKNSNNANNIIKNSLDSLSGFQRFPTWMWRNEVVVEFVDWLHNYNKNLTDDRKIGFYGLDLYSLNKSIEVIINHLDKIDKAASDRARKRYSCFNGFTDKLDRYGYAASLGISPSCGKEVIEQLTEFNINASNYLQQRVFSGDKLFYIEQNARLVKNAENYYRSMFGNRISSWNIRDDHMAETLYLLAKHISKSKYSKAKIVVWAHNSHIGDARATEQGKYYGEINLGQRVREKSGNRAFLLGFMTNIGTVTAASDWDKPAERKNLKPGLKGSYENYFSHLAENFILNLNSNITRSVIPEAMLERAVGVVYKPQKELTSHYFEVNLSKQFDALIYLMETKALVPLETTALWHKGEVYETYPYGL